MTGAHHSAAPGPSAAPCPLCGQGAAHTHERLWAGQGLHIVRVRDPLHPVYLRVIADRHAAEFTDLPRAERRACWDVLEALEAAVRTHCSPDKINLASLGNMVPHLHWHVIGRWADDPHFPDAVWAAPRRPADAATYRAREAALDRAMPALVQTFCSGLDEARDTIGT